MRFSTSTGIRVPIQLPAPHDTASAAITNVVAALSLSLFSVLSVEQLYQDDEIRALCTRFCDEMVVARREWPHCEDTATRAIQRRLHEFRDKRLKRVLAAHEICAISLGMLDSVQTELIDHMARPWKIEVIGRLIDTLSEIHRLLDPEMGDETGDEEVAAVDEWNEYCKTA